MCSCSTGWHWGLVSIGSYKHALHYWSGSTRIAEVSLGILCRLQTDGDWFPLSNMISQVVAVQAAMPGAPERPALAQLVS